MIIIAIQDRTHNRSLAMGRSAHGNLEPWGDEQAGLAISRTIAAAKKEFVDSSDRAKDFEALRNQNGVLASFFRTLADLIDAASRVSKDAAGQINQAVWNFAGNTGYRERHTKILAYCTWTC